jgi:protoporphyrin/coproporphyrin ferrochelatase
MKTAKEIETIHNDVKGAIGVLVLNLGTPDAPTAKAVRPYLREFLSDPRVIELPKWKWLPVLYGIVLTRRPKKSAELYKSIWTKDGSPLLTMTVKQAELLAMELKSHMPESRVEVEVGMRYGNPSIKSALDRLKKKRVRKLLILPLYPQYSGTTTASTFDAVVDALKKWRWIPELRMIMHFHDEVGYIKAIANSIRERWDREGTPERLLFSFHGIPKRYFMSGDPYPCHCQKTARLVAEELNLGKSQYFVSFQSLFGKEEWVRPYTDETLEAWGKEGLNSVDVVCPGFVGDCLETLEEIDEQNRHIFLHAGGKQFRYIFCLNDRPDFINFLKDLSLRNMQGWSDSQQAQANKSYFDAASTAS